MKINELVRADMEQVLAIEQASFDHPWTEDDFVRLLRRRNCRAIVVRNGKVVEGYLVVEMQPGAFHIESMAVRPDARRTYVGGRLVGYLVDRMSGGLGKRSRITLDVRETNLGAQLFFKKQGFRAIKVKRGFYQSQSSPDGAEDAYLMILQMSDIPMAEVVEVYCEP